MDVQQKQWLNNRVLIAIDQTYEILKKDLYLLNFVSPAQRRTYLEIKANIVLERNKKIVEFGLLTQAYDQQPNNIMLQNAYKDCAQAIIDLGAKVLILHDSLQNLTILENKSIITVCQ